MSPNTAILIRRKEGGIESDFRTLCAGKTFCSHPWIEFASLVGGTSGGVLLLLSIPREKKVQERMEVRKHATDPNWLSSPFSLCLSPGFLL